MNSRAPEANHLFCSGISPSTNTKQFKPKDTTIRAKRLMKEFKEIQKSQKPWSDSIFTVSDSLLGFPKMEGKHKHESDKRSGGANTVSLETGSIESFMSSYFAQTRWNLSTIICTSGMCEFMPSIRNRNWPRTCAKTAFHTFYCT